MSIWLYFFKFYHVELAVIPYESCDTWDSAIPAHSLCQPYSAISFYPSVC
jgi:hypothetical protein